MTQSRSELAKAKENLETHLKTVKAMVCGVDDNSLEDQWQTEREKLNEEHLARCKNMSPDQGFITFIGDHEKLMAQKEKCFEDLLKARKDDHSKATDSAMELMRKVEEQVAKATKTTEDMEVLVAEMKTALQQARKKKSLSDGELNDIINYFVSKLNFIIFKVLVASCLRRSRKKRRSKADSRFCHQNAWILRVKWLDILHLFTR